MNDLLHSPGLKVFLIGMLLLIRLVPRALIVLLVGEREQRAASVRDEVAGIWGGPQTIIGPVLIVPYTVARTVMQGDRRSEELIEQRAVFLPERLSIKGNAASNVLHRSIFDVTVYTGDLNVEGRFAAPQLSDVASEVRSVRWRDAVLAVAISDVSGLRTSVSGRINDATIGFEPSLGVPQSRMSGIHLRLANAAGIVDGAGAAPLRGFDFRFQLGLNGSSEFMFAPVAHETSVELTSDWQHPSFAGTYLPVERSIGPDGFKARWQVPHLARSLPQAWSAPDGGLDRVRPFAFGTKFYVPVDHYKQVERALKYSVMFLAIGFIAVLLIELNSARAVHPVQYFFVGFAMVFFFVLLLSFAEHIGFARAYLLSAAATGTMLSIYVGKVQASVLRGAIMAAVFGALYTLLYMILQLEDYALLAGAILGFILITVTMFATLKVNWSRTSDVLPPQVAAG